MEPDFFILVLANYCVFKYGLNYIIRSRNDVLKSIGIKMIIAEHIQQNYLIPAPLFMSSFVGATKLNSPLLFSAINIIP
jgi:hypothetical protein